MKGMRWKRLGKIFDPDSLSLVAGQCGFAQSPQALVYDDFVRVFFSTRTRDTTGSYLSQVAYVDFNKQFNRILNHSTAPVIPLGKLGTFDEHGIFPTNIVAVGNDVYAYTTGWSRRRSVPVDAAIGLAISKDGGRSFTKMGDGPIFGPSLHEPFLVGDGFVAYFDGTFHMWYIHGVRWIKVADGHPDRVYKIAHATSSDGIAWHRSGNRVISDRLNSDECQALPTVIKVDGTYHMWFCYRHAVDFRIIPERGYRIGYAWSNDLEYWHREDENGGLNIAADGWDSEMVCYPNVFHCDQDIYMLYNGNAFGKNGFGLAKLERDKYRGGNT